MIAILTGVRWYPCSFNLHLSNNLRCWTPFHVSLGPSEWTLMHFLGCRDLTKKLEESLAKQTELVPYSIGNGKPRRDFKLGDDLITLGWMSGEVKLLQEAISEPSLNQIRSQFPGLPALLLGNDTALIMLTWHLSFLKDCWLVRRWATLVYSVPSQSHGKPSVKACKLGAWCCQHWY